MYKQSVMIISKPLTVFFCHEYKPQIQKLVRAPALQLQSIFGQGKWISFPILLRTDTSKFDLFLSNDWKNS